MLYLCEDVEILARELASRSVNHIAYPQHDGDKQNDIHRSALAVGLFPGGIEQSSDQQHNDRRSEKFQNRCAEEAVDDVENQKADGGKHSHPEIRPVVDAIVLAQLFRCLRHEIITLQDKY